MSSMIIDMDGDRIEGVERARMTAEELSWALRTMNRASAEVDHSLSRRVQLRSLDYEAMGHIMDEHDSLGPAELAGRLGISAGSATELVDRLERAGHVERRRDTADRRRVTLHARPTAVADILGELGPLFDSLDALALEFSPEEQAAVERYLRRATERMREWTRSERDSAV